MAYVGAAPRRTGPRKRPFVDPNGLAARFEPVLRKRSRQPLTVDEPELTVATEGSLRLVYVPFDLIQPLARVILVGLTPGAYQANLALEAARAVFAAGGTTLGAQAAAKVSASFAGPTRINLIEMLDATGVARHLGLDTTAALFAEARGLVHTTSAVRYAVFANGANYRGNPTRSPLCVGMVRSLLAAEINAVPAGVVVPFGDGASRAVALLVDDGAVDPARCVLPGFPHPSPANGHRRIRFAADQRRLKHELAQRFEAFAAG